MENIYLDAAATTKPNIQIINTMFPYFTNRWYNPSSLYSPSVKVKKDIEKARKTISVFINSEPEEIYFTSSGSEANCWVIQGFIKECRKNNKLPIIITSKIEHKSILDCISDNCEVYNQVDIHNNIPKVCYCDTDKYGYIYPHLLNDILSNITNVLKFELCDYSILVSIQYANNEIGTIQNIKSLCNIAHNYGALFHTDAVQIFGHNCIDVDKLDIDMLSASGHKIGTPKGIGFLYKKNSIKISPIIYGSQERNLRGGTENVPYIIGLGKAVELIQEEKQSKVKEKYLYIEKIRNYLIHELEKIGCKLNGNITFRLANNINVVLPIKISAESFIYMMDSYGIYISAGSACNSNSQKYSHVLKAIGLSNDEIMRTIRITLPENITFDKVNIFLEEVNKSIKLLRE